MGNVMEMRKKKMENLWEILLTAGRKNGTFN